MSDGHGTAETPHKGEVPSDRDIKRAKRRERTVRANFWTKFRAVAGTIPFSRDLLAAFYCALDPRTPFRVKATLLGALAYFIMPIDILPDFIAVVGFTDDAAVLLAALRAVSGAILPEHYTRAETALAEPHEAGIEA